jgi:hypothetical protein
VHLGTTDEIIPILAGNERRKPVHTLDKLVFMENA